MSDSIDISSFDGPHLPSHIYAHVPFCRTKCSYCDFYSIDSLKKDLIEAYLITILSEMHVWSRAGLPGVIETLYIGGGTPTVIVGGLVRIVKEILELAPVRKKPEVTIEANPDSFTPALFDALIMAGVTRVSMGVQSFNEKENAMLGRVHTVSEARSACRTVVDSGLDLSIDLMCGVPGQTLESWKESLAEAIDIGAGHISVYPLTLEEGTSLDAAVGSGLVEPIDPDLAADMMLAAEDMLDLQGLERYEVANYAKPGHECRHNLAYWTGRPYIGLGPAAHGMVDAETASIMGYRLSEGAVRARMANPRDLDAWLDSVEPEIEWLDEKQAAREDAMMGLRLTRGISDALVKRAGVGEILERLGARNLVVHSEGVWRTTTRGWLLGNEVFSEVWLGE